MVRQWPFRHLPPPPPLDSVLTLWWQHWQRKVKERLSQMMPASSAGTVSRCVDKFRGDRLDSWCMHVLLSQQTLPEKTKQSRADWRQEQWGRREKRTYFALHPARTKIQMERIEKSDFLQAFINLMRSSRKMNSQRDCQQVVHRICRATKKVFNL